MTLPALNQSLASSSSQSSGPIEGGPPPPPPVPAVLDARHLVQLPIAPAHTEAQAPALATQQAFTTQVREVPRESEALSPSSFTTRSGTLAEAPDLDPSAVTVHVPAAVVAPPREQMDAAPREWQRHTTLQLGRGAPECQWCADCCGGYGAIVLGVSVGMWICGCPATDPTAMTGGAMLGLGAAHHACQSWECIPELRTEYR